MKTLQIFLILAFAILFFACQKRQELRSREEATSTLDSLMHSELVQSNQYGKELVVLIQNTPDLQQKELYLELLQKLKQTENGLMEWQQSRLALDSLREQKNHRETMAYLKNEKYVLDSLKISLTEALHQCKVLLKK